MNPITPLKSSFWILPITVLLLSCNTEINSKQSFENNVAVLLIEEDVNKQPLKLHVASPEWQDQIIYFLMIDRFNDGNSSNNDQGKGEYDPTKGSHFSGGDLEGISQQLDYIQELGATSIWITPPVANQWWSHKKQFGGFHGYWGINFKKVDAHFGLLSDYKQLSHQLHQRGMYLIQDIVTNHTGNFFGYDGKYNPDDTSVNFEISEAVGSFQWAPEQTPFNLIDRNNPEHVSADIYHWTPGISDYNNPDQESRFQLSGLSDLNTSNDKVRKVLKESYRYWIETVGVDAYRIDTVKFVEHDFWNDFLHSEDGIFKKAKETGRDDFLAFGEIFEISAELSDKGEKKISRYFGTLEKPELNSVIGFPLFGELSRVFALGRPTSNLAYRLRKQMEIYKHPYVVANFVDNHDTQRFLTDGSVDALKQALLTIFTIPGIPVIYQGTEQALEETREAMFAGGYQSKNDHFDKNSEMYRFIQKLAKLRKAHKALTRGSVDIIAEDKSGAGVLAYKRVYQGQQLLIVMNSADREKLVTNLNTGFSDKSELKLLFKENIGNLEQSKFKVSADGLITLVLPARAMFVLSLNAKLKITPQNKHEAIEITINEDYSNNILSESSLITGHINKANAELKLVINGEISFAKTFVANQDGEWQVELPIKRLGYHENRFSVFSKELAVASVEQHYFSNIEKANLEIEITDPDNDDHGPKGQYKAPQHDVSKDQRDIQHVLIKTAGDILELTLTMKQITTVWGPTNGFDNVSFSLFFSIPGKEGNTDLPFLNSVFPDGLKWSVGHVFYGWGNSIFSSESATNMTTGKKLAIAPKISVDESNKTITITYTGQFLGIDNWQGSTVYLSTWDKTGEGEYRPLTAEGGLWEFAGGDENSPKILDDVLIKISSKQQLF